MTPLHIHCQQLDLIAAELELKAGRCLMGQSLGQSLTCRERQIALTVVQGLSN
jgi:hypothetical protein